MSSYPGEQLKSSVNSSAGCWWKRLQVLPSDGESISTRTVQRDSKFGRAGLRQEFEKPVMTRIERDNLIAQLFGEAGELPSAELDSYLTDKCAGDTALLAELKNLLIAHEQGETDGFMQQPVLEDEATAGLFLHD